MEPLPDKKEFKAALQQGLQRIQSLGLSMLYASYVIRNHNTEWRWLQMHFTPLLGELRKKKRADDSQELNCFNICCARLRIYTLLNLICTA